MAVRESYEPGVPSWVDLMSPDVDASSEFYTSLFGWEAVDQHDEEGNRIYVMLRKDGKDAAGLGGQAPGMDGMPAVWNSYVCTEDADLSVKKATEAGGSVMMEPMAVMDSGRMAVLQDPAGAMISVWQPDKHIGAEVVNDHAAFGWSELLTRQPDDVRSFYESVFGWKLVDQDMGPMGTYTVATFDGERSFAGLMQMPEDVPDQIPNYWTVYFGHDDPDAACEQAKELGGSVMAEPFDIPGVGRVAVIGDPQGGVFSVMNAVQWQD